MIEFVVAGIPRSAQTKSPKSRSDWKAKVEAAARARGLQSEIIGGKSFSATIVYFYADETELDVDSIGKLLLDSLVGFLYDDDSQAEQVLLRKTSTTGIVINNPPPILVEALGKHLNFVFVRFNEGPDHKELPA